MRADAVTEAEVQAALKSMNDAYVRRDLSAFMASFAEDRDAVLYGTGADEKRVGPDEIRKQVERDWAQSESAQMAFQSTSISAAGNVAWAAADGKFKFRVGGQDAEFLARASFVLEKRGGKWLIVHAHFSTPATGQEEGESF